MIRRGLVRGLAGLCLALAGTASAQIRVACELNHPVIVSLEPVTATVTVFNDTGFVVPLDGGAGGLRIGFDVARADGRFLDPGGRRGFEVPAEIPAHGSVVVTAALHRIYALQDPGVYAVTARTEWNGAAYLSPRRYLDVVSGVELLKVRAPLPDGSGVRTYRLLTVNRDRADFLLVRVDDEDQRLCYGVINLGRTLPRKPPDVRIDELGKAHILFQRAPGRHAYAICTPGGGLEKTEDLAVDYQQAGLEADAEGKVRVVGTPVPSAPPVYRGALEDEPVRRAAP